MEKTSHNTSVEETLAEISGMSSAELFAASTLTKKGRQLLETQEKIKLRLSRLNEYTKSLSKTKKKIDEEHEAAFLRSKSVLEVIQTQKNELCSKLEALKNEKQDIKSRQIEISIKKHGAERQFSIIESEYRSLESKEIVLISKINQGDPAEYIKSIIAQIGGIKTLLSELESHSQQIRDVIQSHESEAQYIKDELIKEASFVSSTTTKVAESRVKLKEFQESRIVGLTRYQNKHIIDLAARKENREAITLTSSSNEAKENAYNNYSSLLELIDKQIHGKHEENRKKEMKIKEIMNRNMDIQENTKMTINDQQRQKKRRNEIRNQKTMLKSQIEIIRASRKAVDYEKEKAEEKMASNKQTLKSLNLKLKMQDMNDSQLSELLQKTEANIKETKENSNRIAIELDKVYQQKLKEIDIVISKFNAASEKEKGILQLMQLECTRLEEEMKDRTIHIDIKRDKYETSTKKFQEVLQKKEKFETQSQKNVNEKQSIIKAIEVLTEKSRSEMKGWNESSELPESRLNAWDEFIENINSYMITFSNNNADDQKGN